MEQNIKNNNNILLELVNDLLGLKNYSKDNYIIKTLENVINKLNYIINENKKNSELIKNDLNTLNNKFDKLNQEMQIDYGRYIGEIVNGLPEGQGILYADDGSRYEGGWKNGKLEGKGIAYLNNGDRYEGDWKNGLKEGKGIYYYNREPYKGDRYEGEYKNNKQEGKGILYYNNGDKYEGDFKKGKQEGKGIL